MFLFGVNLKMHQTPQQTREFLQMLRERVARVPKIERAGLWVIPPFTSIAVAAEAAHGSGIRIGAQNMHWADEGAFTGEISPLMLKACGAEFVMLGHAERRTLFGESDEMLNKKVLAAARHGLGVMLCVGEPSIIKAAGAGAEYVAQQLKLALCGLAPPGDLQVLYEPLWSVGEGGVAADPDYVSAAFGNIRRVLRELFGPAGERVPILYGGSVDATNCARYARLPNGSGMGVGRAGWNVDRFVAVLAHALAALD
ncbi:MAG: triosephosphate isomerase [Candidatus Roseilinea sp.]|nr:MAG: triosephosphate isomerase [Candidatus Roseilinea sp.]